MKSGETLNPFQLDDAYKKAIQECINVKDGKALKAVTAKFVKLSFPVSKSKRKKKS
jgi:hypothetical protein